MGSDVRNKAIRQQTYAKSKKEKAHAKLARRLAIKEKELADPELRLRRLAENQPRTIENTREWVGNGWGNAGKGKEAQQGSSVDRRTLPIHLVDDGRGGQRLDLAGLEDLFPGEDELLALPSARAQHAASEATTSAETIEDEKPSAGLILLTTAPSPSYETVKTLKDLQSLLGGASRAQIVPRKTSRFVLSKVARWAAKRGYAALMVVGEDNKRPSSVTISKLPAGPTAHFRLTSVELNKAIQGHGAPTSHTPELVLSNMSTPLGLSIGRLLGTLFPPTPQFEGRQVVVVHNQRDFLFVRRFRYMFDLRPGDDASQKRAIQQGMDTDVRTRMQELGPRLTLKLRWLMRGTLADGRRRASGALSGAASAPGTHDFDVREDGGDADSDLDGAVGGTDPPILDPTRSGLPTEPSQRPPVPASQRSKALRKSSRPQETAGIVIPRLRPTPDAVPTKGNLAKRRRKPKPGASVLDSINFQGGMDDGRKEWAWDPRMQVSKRKFFM